MGNTIHELTPYSSTSGWILDHTKKQEAPISGTGEAGSSTSVGPEPAKLRKSKKRQVLPPCATPLSAEDLERTDRSRKATPKQIEQSERKTVSSTLQDPLPLPPPQNRISSSEGEKRLTKLEQPGSDPAHAYQPGDSNASPDEQFPQPTTLPTYPVIQAVSPRSTLKPSDNSTIIPNSTRGSDLTCMQETFQAPPP